METPTQTPTQTPIPSPAPVPVEVVSTATGAAKLFGVLGLIAAILSFLVPVIGPLFFTLFAILFGIIALRGGSKGLGIATTIIVVLTFILSPTFWVNLFASAESGPNRIIAIIDIIGVLAMLYYVATGRRA